MVKKRPVNIKVSKLFFDKFFEPKRKEMENILGKRISQPDFTEYLVKTKINFKMPKFKSKKHFPRNNILNKKFYGGGII